MPDSTSKRRLTNSDKSLWASSPELSHFIERGSDCEEADTSVINNCERMLTVICVFFASCLRILGEENIKKSRFWSP